MIEDAAVTKARRLFASVDKALMQAINPDDRPEIEAKIAARHDELTGLALAVLQMTGPLPDDQLQRLIQAITAAYILGLSDG